MLTNELNAMVSSLKIENLNINKLLAMLQHFTETDIKLPCSKLIKMFTQFQNNIRISEVQGNNQIKSTVQTYDPLPIWIIMYHTYNLCTSLHRLILHTTILTSNIFTNHCFTI